MEGLLLKPAMLLLLLLTPPPLVEGRAAPPDVSLLLSASPGAHEARTPARQQSSTSYTCILALRALGQW